MPIKHITKKIKLAAVHKVKAAPRWVDLKKFGIKRSRTRRFFVKGIKRWRRQRVRV